MMPLPSYHQKRVIKIPVNSTDVRKFCQRSDKFYYKSVGFKLYRFINPILCHFNIFRINLYFALCEMVGNAYDSYAKRGLKLGEFLVLEAVVQCKEDMLIVKIKDNGAGFINEERGTFFSRQAIQYEKKTLDFNGGCKLGVKLLEEDLTQDNGRLWFKQRKELGAALYMVFDLASKEERLGCRL